MALGLRSLARDYLPPGSYSLFLLGVLLSSWWGGVGPALLSVALSIYFSLRYFLPADNTLAETIIQILSFGLVAGATILVNNLLGQARKAALALAQAKSEFAANVSHEIRTPLTALMGYTDQLLDTKLSLQQKKMVQTIHSASASLLRTVNEMLDFARGEAHGTVLSIRTVDLQDCLRENYELLAPLGRSKELQCNLRLDPSLHGQWRIALEALQIAFSNLTGNAIKFTEHGSVNIEASTRVEAGQSFLRVDIRDTGIGIPRDVQDRLFLPFSQGDPTTARRFGGTGLGLAVARQWVQRAGGSIGFASEKGNGAHFWFELPVLALAASDSRSRILVVDDQSINRTLVRNYLESMGFAVTEAHSGVEALDVLEREPISLVLMDCHMPEMDGYETTRKIRASSTWRDLPVLALTASDTARTRELCLKNGMWDIVSKPIAPYDLEGKVRAWLKQSPPHATAGEPQVLDLSRWVAIASQSAPLLDEVVETFLRTAPERERQLSEARTNKDHRAIERFAHSLRSVAAALGADRLQRACAAVENHALDERGIAELEVEYQNAISVMQDALNQRRSVQL